VDAEAFLDAHEQFDPEEILFGRLSMEGMLLD
jgi:hypothetical protein